MMRPKKKVQTFLNDRVALCRERESERERWWKCYRKYLRIWYQNDFYMALNKKTFAEQCKWIRFCVDVVIVCAPGVLMRACVLLYGCGHACDENSGSGTVKWTRDKAKRWCKTWYFFLLLISIMQTCILLFKCAPFSRLFSFLLFLLLSYNFALHKMVRLFSVRAMLCKQSQGILFIFNTDVIHLRRHVYILVIKID